MESQKPTTPESTTPKSAKKLNKNAVLLTILVIIAVGGLAFGGFELWQNMKKDDEIKKLQAETNQNVSYTPEDDTTDDIANDDNSVVPANNDSKQTSDAIGTVDITIKTNVLECISLEGSKAYNSINYCVYDDKLSFRGSSENDDAQRRASEIHYSGNSFGGKVFDESFKREVTFDGEVKQALYGHYGNGGDSAIFLLRTDGTVGVVYPNKDFSDVEVIQYLDGVNGVNEIYKGMQGSTAAEIIGLCSDGRYYTLASIFVEQIK